MPTGSPKIGSPTLRMSPRGGSPQTFNPIAPPEMTFSPDQPYDPANGLPAPDIREDFSGLTFEAGFDPQSLLDRLAVWLPADTLREFMDDLAMGRI
jgi:hypothetical protein